MAATLTTSNGYLVYTTETKTFSIPLSLLADCTIVKYTDFVSIILPSETNAHTKSFVDIFPEAGGNITTISAIEAYLQNSQLQSIQSGDFAIQIETDATYTYIAYAKAGSALTDAVWKVKRITTVSGITKWADGNANFDNLGNSITTLTYA